MHDVEQVVEPTARIGPPNGEAWPGSPIPDDVDLQAHPPAVPHHSVVHLRHYSLHPFSKLLPPFPMCPALPDSQYYGGSAPSRTNRSTVDPARKTTPEAFGIGQGPERFPCSLTTRSTKEEPNSVPAASPRLPRSTSPWPPGRTSTCPPASSPTRPTAGMGAHRIRPISTGGAIHLTAPLCWPQSRLCVCRHGLSAGGSASVPGLPRGPSTPAGRTPLGFEFTTSSQ